MSFSPDMIYGAFSLLSLFVAITLIAASKQAHTKTIGALILIWQCPLILLYNSSGIIPADYIAHLGQIALVAQQVKIGDIIPTVTNSIQLTGDPTISFYGRAYFEFAALLTLFTGPSIAVRIEIELAALMQIVSLFTYLHKRCKSYSLALIVTSICYFSSYMMNNLYVRGAIAEFIAANLIASASVLLLTWWSEATVRRTKLLLATSTLYGLALTIHPITGVLGGIVLIVQLLAMTLYFGFRKPGTGELILAFLCFLAVTTPWIYLILSYPPAGSALASSFKLVRFEGLDVFWLRILPFPLSRMPLSFGHPIFVGQINTLGVLCACLFVFMGFCHSKRLTLNALVSILMVYAFAALFLVISLTSLIDGLLPSILLAAQYGYRLVNVVNLLISLSILLAIGDVKGDIFCKKKYLVSYGLISFASTLGVFYNLIQMEPAIIYESNGIIAHDRPKNPRYSFLATDATRDDVIRYEFSLGCLYARVPPQDILTSWCNTTQVDLAFHPNSKGELDASISPPDSSRSWQTTNVVNFPWNKIYANGLQALTRPYQWFFAVKIDSTVDNIQVKTQPPRLYLIMNFLSYLWISIVSVIAVFDYVFRLKFSRDNQEQSCQFIDTE